MNPDPLGIPPFVLLAPLWRRVLAQVIDQAVVVIPVLLIAVLMGVRNTGDLSDHTFGINVAVVSVAFVYGFGSIAMWGRTIGKWVLGTKVIRVDTAGPVLPSSAAIRSLVPLAAGVLPGVGQFLSLVIYATAFFDRRRQGWHDKAAGTIVVMKRQKATR